MDLVILAVIIWVGYFLVVAIDSAFRRISPWFWHLAVLFGGPFALLAYGLVRERDGKAQEKQRNLHRLTI